MKHIELAEKYGAHNYAPLPVVLERGEGVWVWDTDGNKYMDFLSSYSALNQGHNHPRIVNALVEQAHKLSLASRAFYDSKFGEYAQYLAKLCNKEAVLPMNSGAEAVESAIKIARKWGYKEKGVAPNRAEIIVCRNNFHGRTTTIVGFSSHEQYKDGFGPFTPGFNIVEYGNIEAISAAVTPNTVAVLIEPIQGEGGIIVPPDGYIAQLQDICSSNRILLLADEVQTGLGRTGRMFACDHDGVVPDMYILGKALSGGMYPVSAVVANRSIMDVLGPGDHGSTFGGNPLGSAVALEALKVIKEEQLAQNARAVGKYLTDGLKKLNSPYIKEIRGRGLLIGLEIDTGKVSAKDLCLRLKEQGILCNVTHQTVIRLAPPLIITQSQVDWALERIAKVF